MKPRILFGSIFHETHTFLEGSISWSDFTVTRGEEILKKLGDGSPTDGFLQVAQDAGLEVVPLLDVRCLPCEIVEDQVFEQFWSEYAPRATEEIAKGIDAFYLVLHGGMCTETIRDPEGEFLARIRSLPGAADIPIFGVFDLHANLSLRTFQLSQGLVSYRNNPHNDSRESAMRAAQIMVDALAEKRIPRTLGCQIPLLLPPPATGTDDDPMKAMETRARQLEEQHPDILVINIVAGFAFADSTRHRRKPQRDLSRRRRTRPISADRDRRPCLVDERKGGDQLPHCRRVTRQDLNPIQTVPTLLVEPSDNIGGGAPGDCTGCAPCVSEARHQKRPPLNQRS